MRRILMAVGSILALAALIAPAAHATQEEPPPPVETAECRTDVPLARYSRSTSTTEHEVDKFVRTRERETRHYSYTGGKRSTLFPPAWPGDPGDWQANTAQEPHGDADEGLHWTGQWWNASWFFFDVGEFGDWSEPTRWVPTGSHLDWVAEIPAPDWQHHGSGSTHGVAWERQWTPGYPTGETRQVPGPDEVSDLLPAPPEGDGWTKVDGSDEIAEGEAFPCPTATATAGDCEAPGIITRQDSPAYTAALSGSPSATVVTFTAIDPLTVPQTVVVGPFDITERSIFDCTEIPEPTEREASDEDVDCDSDEVTITTTTYRTDPVWDPETETYVPGEEEAVASSTSTRAATEEECPTTVTTTPPTTTPPTTTPPKDTPPPAAPPAPPAPPTAESSLPVTGSPVGALLALAALLAIPGLGLLAVSRFRRA